MPKRRTVIVGAGTALTVALAGCTGDDTEVVNPPETEFDSEEIDTPEDPDEPRTLQITVTGGDSFDSDAVFVRGEHVTDEHENVAWYELDDERDDGDEVSEGASIAVHVTDESAFRIDLEWEHTDYDDPVALYHALGEEADPPDD